MGLHPNWQLLCESEAQKNAGLPRRLGAGRGRPPAPLPRRVLLLDPRARRPGLARAVAVAVAAPGGQHRRDGDVRPRAGVHAGRAERRDRGVRLPRGRQDRAQPRALRLRRRVDALPPGRRRGRRRDAQVRVGADGRARGGRPPRGGGARDGRRALRQVPARAQRRARLGAVGARRRRADVCGRAERGAVGGGLPAALRAVGVVGRDHVQRPAAQRERRLLVGVAEPRRLLRRRAVGRPRRGVAPPRLRRRLVGRLAGECGGDGAAVGRLLVGRLDVARRRRRHRRARLRRPQRRQPARGLRAARRRRRPRRQAPAGAAGRRRVR